MSGMNHGGARVGAGRKPRNPGPLAVFAGGRAEDVPKEPPAGLLPDQASIWRDYVELAIGQQTLIPATVPAFVNLCEVEDQKRKALRLCTFLQDKILAGQPVDMRAFERSQTHHAKLAKLADSLYARFKLAPFGKPAIDGAKRKATMTNPWAVVAK